MLLDVVKVFHVVKLPHAAWRSAPTDTGWVWSGAGCAFRPLNAKVGDMRVAA